MPRPPKVHSSASAAGAHPVESYRAKVERVFTDMEINRDIVIFEAIYQALEASINLTQPQKSSLVEDPVLKDLKINAPRSYFEKIIERGDAIAKEAITLTHQYNKRGQDAREKKINFAAEIKARQENLALLYAEKFAELVDLVNPHLSDETFFSAWTILIKKTPNNNLTDEIYKIAYLQLFFSENQRLPRPKLTSETYQHCYEELLSLLAESRGLKELSSQINVWGFANTPSPKREQFQESNASNSASFPTRVERIESILAGIKLLLPNHLLQLQQASALKHAEHSNETDKESGIHAHSFTKK